MAKRRTVAVVLEASGVLVAAFAAGMVDVAAGVGLLGVGMVVFGVAVERGGS